MGHVTYRNQLIRCGRESCAVCRDGPAHGPYWYAYWRDERGRAHSEYLGKTRHPPGGAPDQLPPLEVRMLGGFDVSIGGMSVEKSRWGRAAARRLFALLLLHPDGISRDAAAECLWPDELPERSKAALSASLSAIRHALRPGRHRKGGARTGSRLPVRQPVLRLHLLPTDSVDIAEFGSADPAALDVDTLTHLVDLYRGDLLPEFLYDDWAAAPRERLRDRWTELSTHLADRLREEGRSQEAILCLETVLDLDGSQEAAARLLMELLAGRGQRVEALRAYHRLKTYLETELSATPDSATEIVADRIRSDGPADDGAQKFEAVHALDGEIHRLALQPPNLETARRLAKLWAERAEVFSALGEAGAVLSSAVRGQGAIAGLDLPTESAELSLLEAAAHSALGNAEPTLIAAERAAESAVLAGAAALHARALILRAQALEELGRLDGAIAAAHDGAAIADKAGTAELGLLARRIAALSTWRAGRFAEAESLHHRNLVTARAIGKVEWEGYILCGLTSALWAQGKLGEAEAHLTEALALADRRGDRCLTLHAQYQLGNLWRDRALVLNLRGRHQVSVEARGKSLQCFELALRLAQTQDNAYMTIFTALDLGCALVEWDETQRARPYIVLAGRMAETLANNATAKAWVSFGVATLALAEGDPAGALANAVGAIDALGAASPGGLAEAHRLAAMARVAMGETGAAEEHWAASLRAATTCGQRIERVRTRLALARCRRSGNEQS